MTLATGSRLGPYEIVSPIGAGGMGEVFLARDTRLERSVAIKILSREFATSPQLLQRFDREAKSISQLNHPHICTLYDVGQEGDIRFLVMEMLEGESLADRLGKGALPVTEVVKFGAQIADALDRAHRSGIVHRDLKPGNVMITKGGAKLLDFGLAKPNPMMATASGSMVTQQKPLTQEGTIVGTFQYMAPEQLEGLEADSRTDIFALGVLLYEMATGRRAFEGRTRTSLIAAIVGSQPPPLSQVQPLTPPALEHVIAKCLAKDPDDRWQSAHDIASELKWISEAGSQAGVAAPLTAKRKQRERFAWLLHVVTAFVAIALTWSFLHYRQAPPRLIESNLLAPKDNQFNFRLGSMALSPDGTRIAFVAGDGKASPSLWVRTLSSGAGRQLPGTENAIQPFWSPDSRQIGFFAEGKLKTIDESGGPAQTLCDASQPRGGTWGTRGTILFAPTSNQALLLIPAAGGTPRAVTTLQSGEVAHLFPGFLPDGEHFLYLLSGGTGPTIAVGSVDGKLKKRLLTSPTLAEFAPPDFMLFNRDGVVMAQHLDMSRWELLGSARPIAQNVGVMGRRPLFSATATDIAYQQGEALNVSELVWVDRQGKQVGTVGPPALYYSPKISHDGRRIAVDISSKTTGLGDIWIFDLARNLSSRLTFNPANESGPVWTPDDRDIIFFSERDGRPANIYRISSGGTGQEELLVDAPFTKLSADIPRDGRSLLLNVNHDQGNVLDIWLYSIPEKKLVPWLATPFAESAPQVSPDGKWIVYQSNESGRNEIYVRNFPDSREKWLVSNGGGSMPAWRGDGGEIYYISAEHKMMAVPVKLAAGLEAGTPVPLFEVRILDHPSLRQYDVTADGQRFLLDRPITQESSDPITLVQNWKARIPKE
jgi:serine/threonine protein kinase/Tol biopolymer transport system component